MCERRTTLRRRQMSSRNLRDSGVGSSPEDIMRKIFLRWINYRMSVARPFLDLRDMFRTENLLALTELCLGAPVSGAIAKPSLPADHDTNYGLKRKKKKKKSRFLIQMQMQLFVLLLKRPRWNGVLQSLLLGSKRNSSVSWRFFFGIWLRLASLLPWDCLLDRFVFEYSGWFLLTFFFFFFFFFLYFRRRV